MAAAVVELKDAKKARAEAGMYLTFVLGKEEYGLEILKVREIIKVMDITSVPRMPDYVKGVINLRGSVIPVIDLRLKFGIPPTVYTQETCIIVVEALLEGEGVQMGIVVDTVSEVLNIAAADIEAPPSFGGHVNTEFILGMGKVKNKVKILLDINRILTSDELELIADVK